jgi:hypothetical protein
LRLSVRGTRFREGEHSGGIEVRGTARSLFGESLSKVRFTAGRTRPINRFESEDAISVAATGPVSHWTQRRLRRSRRSSWQRPSGILRDPPGAAAARGPLTRVSTARRTLKGNKAHGRIDRRDAGNGFAEARTRRWSKALKVTAPLGIASVSSGNGTGGLSSRQRGESYDPGLAD